MGAHVVCAQESTGTQAEAISDSEGFYALPLQPPGLYSVRVTASTYQAQEAQEIELPVAGRLDLHFLMRPLATFGKRGSTEAYFFRDRRP